MQNGDIPDSRITASSFGQSLYRPEQGRLHYQGDGGFKLPAWEVSPGSNRIGEWIQIDLGSVTNVTGVATQGNGIIAKQDRSGLQATVYNPALTVATLKTTRDARVSTETAITTQL